MKSRSSLLSIAAVLEAACMFLLVHCDGEPETGGEENTLQLCSDGVDNDGNGLVDCSDPSCSFFCGPELCSDGMDNDGDLLIDCRDPDCEHDPACATADEICGDTIDNDGDTLADCSDPDCEDDPLCSSVDEICDDGGDNDGDTLVDCDDPDCSRDPVCEVEPGCRTTADCEDQEACIAGQCESLRGGLFCSEPERALVLVDQRLYEHIFTPLHDYIQAACSRRGFGIRIVGESGLDDMGYEEVKNRLTEYTETYPSMEGVLFIGNVPIPSFFMSRLDTPQVQYWPRYYEDIDMIAQKTIGDGTVLQACTGGFDPEGYPDGWPCIAPDIDLWPAPFTVPAHDFDDFDQGPRYGLELWAAFLPVGLGDPVMDTYDYWGEQLKPFLRKTLVFYENPDSFYRNLYHVGNDIHTFAQVETVWNEIGPENIDYYAVNTLGEGLCENNPDCYVRAPLEDYDSLEAFVEYAQALPWMGEGWQSPVNFLIHMNSDNHFPRSIVWWNVHSTPTLSIITSAQARTAIEPGRGGLIALLDGCMVGGFQMPGSPLPADDHWEIPCPADNMLVSLVYGTGAFTAAIGSLPLRTMFDRFGVLFDRIYVDGYLGLANRERSDAQDLDDDRRWGYRGHQEILVGDPFVDAH